MPLTAPVSTCTVAAPTCSSLSRAGPRGADLVDARLGGVHRLLGERRGDPQAAAVDLVLGEQRVAVLVLELQQLGLDHRQDVALLPAVGALGLLRVELGQPLGRLLRLVGSDLVGLGHAVEDVGVALAQRDLGVLAVGRVEVVRVVDDARQRRALLERELGGRLVEVGDGGGLDPVGAAPEVDGVEVALEDLLLAHLPTQLEGEDRLLELAGVGALLGEVEDLDVLLGDRRRTLSGVARRVVEHRADDALVVDPAVAPEGAVLGGHTASLTSCGISS